MSYTTNEKNTSKLVSSRILDCAGGSCLDLDEEKAQGLPEAVADTEECQECNSGKTDGVNVILNFDSNNSMSNERQNYSPFSWQNDPYYSNAPVEYPIYPAQGEETVVVNEPQEVEVPVYYRVPESGKPEKIKQNRFTRLFSWPTKQPEPCVDTWYPEFP